MADALNTPSQVNVNPLISLQNFKWLIAVIACLTGAIIANSLLITFNDFALDDELFLDSTLGEVAIWMTDQAEEDEPESILGQYAQTRRNQVGEDNFDETLILSEAKNILVGFTGILAICAVLGAIGFVAEIPQHRWLLLVALLGLDGLILLIPVTPDDQTITWVLIGITAISFVLIFTKAKIERVVGFLVLLSLFLVAWEASKAVAHEIRYEITTPAGEWAYDTYADLESALTALDYGEVDAILADRRDLDDMMLPYPQEDEVELETNAFEHLRYLDDFERSDSQLVFTVNPALPGRIAVATSLAMAEEITSLNDLESLTIGTVSESFAETDFLAIEREASLARFKIFNDLNLPHLQSIAEAMFQPARRNGPLLLVRILANAALYTLSEAMLGFVIGAMLGFGLGTLFTHVNILQRSLLPYVVASQTIPIIALAPMIVIWLRDTHPILPVAVISAYLTFFPVTINTLRGLQSPQPMAVDLMKSYAASSWDIMWKLRFPSALPYIFTALKVSATASVVGAIIGELPSGVSDGLGRAILNFSSDYSLISTPKLWGAILMAAFVGILFFMTVTLLEQFVLRKYTETN